MPKKTPAQKFHDIFKQWTSGATEAVRKTAGEKMDAWLARNGKTRADISTIVADAVADDLKANPPPPPSDPRDTAPHPFEDPQFTPASLIEGIVTKYVTMSPHASVIYTLWICLTHVYTRYTIAPRIALTGPTNTGKTTLIKIGRRLARRPNPQSQGTGATIRDFIDEGPCTIFLDELDYVDADGKRMFQLIWNLGHDEEIATYSLKVMGRTRVLNLYAPMMVAGVDLIGGFLTETQQNRAFTLKMPEHSERNEPELEYTVEIKDRDRIEDFVAVYSFLHHWAVKVEAGEIELKPKPAMPKALRRFGDNIRGLLAIADSCGPEWGRRAREAMMFFLAQERAERPQIVFIRHGLVIFDTSSDELGQIDTHDFNRALKRLDLPDAMWASLTMPKQGMLAAKVGIHSVSCWPPGKRQRGASFRG